MDRVGEAIAACMAGQGPEDCPGCPAYEPGCLTVRRGNAVIRFCGGLSPQEIEEISAGRVGPEQALAIHLASKLMAEET